MSIITVLKRQLHSTSLKIGDKAPLFSGIDDSGNTISLTHYKGKKVVLYFYPKDNTLGCTNQSCNLTDNYELLQKRGYEVIGVSADSVKSHQKFKAKFSLEKMTELLGSILNEKTKPIPKFIPLELPKLNKIELPKLKKL